MQQLICRFPFFTADLITDEGRGEDGTTSNTYPKGIQWGGHASPQGGKQRGRTHGAGVGHGWDLDFNDVDFEERFRKCVEYDKKIGCQYITCQMFLPPVRFRFASAKTISGG